MASPYLAPGIACALSLLFSCMVGGQRKSWVESQGFF